MSRRGGRAMRLRGLVRKEFLQIRRDPSSIAIAFILPVFLLLLFGYGVSLDARHVPLALIVESPTALTADFSGSFFRSEYFEPRHYTDMPSARRAMLRGDIAGILYLRSDFGSSYRSRRGAPVQLIVNGVNANTARLVQGYVTGAWVQWLQRHGAATGQAFRIPVQLEQRVWFNAELRSTNFLVPGLIAVIMTLIGALLTALVVAREWERGTMEALMATPVSIGEILMSKIIPYFILGMCGMALSVAMAVWQFDVPLRGSLGALFLGASLFLLVALGMGLMISTVARNQFVAGQVAIIVTFLPAFILSGFIFEIGSMPVAVQVITHFVPARYFVALLQTGFLAGDIWSVYWPNMLALLVLAAFFLGRTRHISHKRLD